ncbi:sigma-54-dependent Fis family transcriptional regulator [Vibrio navarrensis]|uniref:Sigma-54-dependent Fis family transcriptional regulator n=1 Tax=Vibrio navarrensis TaxID=29495 RepID=A0AAJ4I9M4_9VIBR|nr:MULTISPECIES: quorum-sensing sigma-54 dependent transcriptional regulator LuxO [Vibrio]KJR29048.1 ATPase AAA [Vibrio sp. S234-5]MBE3653638.1 sigma-54-dependent Fis family transcriptional regulator [Vibrio navarrensis]MBE3661978.1 sigma-54-dependent Fis family transcriptional regulator [Vibrio navarrensis]MBE3668091.1 sigma-54-dependent Fis family transcriptional regulator [Vibrio navarrensis]MBE4591746.1 sigma-54-dependent Fis family transcriptional regulator [Vibrio navarrensis]
MQHTTDAPRSRYLLMVEDTASVAALYRSYLTPLGIDINIVGTGRDAIESLKHRIPDLILLDLRLPDMTGMDVLHAVKASHPDVPIIFMTAHGSIDTAVEAMRHGSQDFLIKPCEADRLRVTVNNAIRKASKLKNEADSPANQNYQGFIGSSQKMQQVYRTIDSAASSKASIFITGESGTGKEVCAEAIHAASRRGDKPFIAINCAAIPKDLIESELFGHVKGAFTGAATDRQGAAELADGGTLFLDELCEMDLDLQTKLLRFIQTGTFQKVGSSKMKSVDVRFVCATNRDPWKEVQEGRFREDLYYRLYVIPLHLPPLRERGEDVIEIAYSLLGYMSHEEGKNFVRFSPQVLDRFNEYEWPGNVRQLQNVLRNIVVLNNGKEITMEMLPPPLNQPLARSENRLFKELEPVSVTDIYPLWMTEKMAIEQAIKACDGNIPRAAGYLDVSPSTIYRKLQTWNGKEESRARDGITE